MFDLLVLVIPIEDSFFARPASWAAPLRRIRERLRDLTAGHLGKPAVPGCADAGAGADRHRVVKVGDQVAGFLQERSSAALASTTPVTPLFFVTPLRDSIAAQVGLIERSLCQWGCDNVVPS
jgi:hypothetical protein